LGPHAILPPICYLLFAIRYLQSPQARPRVGYERHKAPVAFGEALPTGTRLTLFSNDKPERLFTVMKFWMDETSGVALALRGGVPTLSSRKRRLD
jgi:hypothetical protein